MILAFKNAARAAQLETGLAKIFSDGIARVTGGVYSHVALGLIKDRDSGLWQSFQAIEPDGTGFANLDFDDVSLWTTVDVPNAYAWTEQAAQYSADLAWCQGRRDRRYNFKGLAAIEFGGQFTDKYDDFCSQVAFEFLQDRRGMFAGWSQTEWIAPSGFGKDGKRFGLYELMTGSQTLP